MAIDADVLTVPQWDVIPALVDVPVGARQAVQDKEIDADQLNAGWGWALQNLDLLQELVAKRALNQTFYPGKGIYIPDISKPVGGKVSVPPTSDEGQIAYRFIDGTDQYVVCEALVVRNNPQVIAVWSTGGTDNTKNVSWQLEYQLLDAGGVPGSTVVSGGSALPADDVVAHKEIDTALPLTLDAGGADLLKRLWLKLTYLGSQGSNTLDKVDLKRIEVR